MESRSAPDLAREERLRREIHGGRVCVSSIKRGPSSKPGAAMGWFRKQAGLWSCGPIRCANSRPAILGAERGIFHTKDEPLSKNGFHRLHILSGESLSS